MTIEVLLEEDPGHPVEDILAAAQAAMDAMHVHPAAELSVRFVDEAAMASLHEEWLGLSGPTDVMSFPLDELNPGTPEKPSEPGLLGDIVLCPAVAARQAQQLGHPVGEELQMLTIHGVLHLLGFDHDEPVAEREMFTLQRQILTAYLGRVSSAAPEPGQQGVRTPAATPSEPFDPTQESPGQAANGA